MLYVILAYDMNVDYLIMLYVILADDMNVDYPIYYMLF